jgi:hypothetical protein
MEIKNFIKIYDDALPLSIIGNIIRFSNVSKFNEASIIGDNKGNSKIDFNVRKTYTYSLSNQHENMSAVHWFCLLSYFFSNYIKKYSQDLNILDLPLSKLDDIAILKYQDKGFYTWHVDHAASVPRSLSCILLLNNDYEGGNLCFKNPDGSGEWEVEVKPNRMIIWPSIFLYPHTVKPVTKGKRYSVVAWAL